MLPSRHALSRSALFYRSLIGRFPQLRELFLAASMVGLALPGVGQEPNPEDVLRVRTNLVTVPTMVTDVKGRRVAGLKQDDFLIRDEGKIVRLDHFSNGSDRVALVFLLDASGSSRGYLDK